MTIKELKPINDRQQSFYKKAYVIIDGNTKILQSYNTQVCKIVDGKFFRLWSGYSDTTKRHINEFRTQNGFEPINKKQWFAMDCEGNKTQYKIHYNNGFVYGSLATIYGSFDEAQKECDKHSNKKSMFVYWVEEVAEQ